MTREGTERLIAWRHITIRDQHGTITGLLSSGEDISEKRKIEEQLRQHQRWLATTLNSVGDGVITTDTKGAITYMNPVATQLTGWTSKEAHGMPLSEVFHIYNERTREKAENPVEKVLKNLYVVGLANHTALVARDGTERPIADSGAPIIDEEGQILGVVLVFRDMTEQRAREAQMQHHQKLESLEIGRAHV